MGIDLVGVDLVGVDLVGGHRSEKWHVANNFKFAVTGKIILFPDR